MNLELNSGRCDCCGTYAIQTYSFALEGWDDVPTLCWDCFTHAELKKDEPEEKVEKKVEIIDFVDTPVTAEERWELDKNEQVIIAVGDNNDALIRLSRDTARKLAHELLNAASECDRLDKSYAEHNEAIEAGLAPWEEDVAECTFCHEKVLKTKLVVNTEDFCMCKPCSIKRVGK